MFFEIKCIPIKYTCFQCDHISFKPIHKDLGRAKNALNDRNYHGASNEWFSLPKIAKTKAILF